MSGNVWEWVSSSYRDYPYDPNDGREAGGGSRVQRGGSWNYYLTDGLRAAGRYWGFPDDSYDSNGFRCARSF